MIGRNKNENSQQQLRDLLVFSMEVSSTVPTLSARHRFVVLSTWEQLAANISPKGFGAFEAMKSRIGAPTHGPVLGQEDPQAVVEEFLKKDAKEETGWTVDEFRALDPDHELSALFYAHLFSRTPTMVGLFWRFNLYQSLEKIVAVIGNADPVQLKEQFNALAQRHKGRGITSNDYDIIGQSVRHVIGTKLSADDTESWMVAWNVFVNAMKVTATDEQLIDASAASLTNNEATLREFSMEEVSRHCTDSSAWLVIDGNVYDVTKFIRAHPGGLRILDGCGKDATKLFRSMHSKYAVAKLPRFLIGKLAAEEASK